MNQQNVSANGKRVPIRHWLYLAGVLILTLVLSSAYAGKSQGAERGDLGFITVGTHLCHTDNITPQTTDGLEQWASLIERLEAAGDIIFLSAEDNELGTSLATWCSTLATGYPVVMGHEDGEYALVYWDRKLGFGVYSFLIRLRDFQAGGLRL